MKLPALKLNFLSAASGGISWLILNPIAQESAGLYGTAGAFALICFGASFIIKKYPINTQLSGAHLSEDAVRISFVQDRNRCFSGYQHGDFIDSQFWIDVARQKKAVKTSCLEPRH